MAILQAIIFMIYQIQVLSIFAYYPEIVSILFTQRNYSLDDQTNAMQCDAIRTQDYYFIMWCMI